MKVRNIKTGNIGVALATGVAVFLALLVPAAANAAPTKAFDGEGFTVKPAQLGGLTSFGGDDSDPVLISGRAGTPKKGFGPIQWQSWKKNKAVGKGAGWTEDCSRPCKGSFPWDGANLRVTLYRKLDGHFSKMIVHARRNSAKNENYLMKATFRGDRWEATMVEDGLAKQSSTTRAAIPPVTTGPVTRPKETMIYHGNGFAIRPANLYNWEYDGYQSGMTGGQDISGLKGESTAHFPDGKMKWKRWDKRSAVGVGGLHTYCGTLSKKECKKSPWYGTPQVKVRAYGLESGHFSKMRITRTGDGPKQFMILRFIGKHLTPAWKITREVTG